MNITEKEELIDQLQAHYQTVLTALDKLSPFTELTDEHLRMSGMRAIWADYIYHSDTREIEQVCRNRSQFLPIIKRMIEHPEEFTWINIIQ
jgi:hypothetical protein